MKADYATFEEALEVIQEKGDLSDRELAEKIYVSVDTAAKINEAIDAVSNAPAGRRGSDSYRKQVEKILFSQKLK